jgi:hypothetical protein
MLGSGSFLNLGSALVPDSKEAFLVLKKSYVAFINLNILIITGRPLLLGG